ncbi:MULTISPECIES: aldo/keto reductase [unclassified Frondihabitans]|uniref:aldo/keto reductase n=1 Tax=unclassified Frondihabitans TaxID=2626248 RepID=UPI000F4DF7C3|nr:MULTISPECIES: aldo/keto reductase [unclassified Frondihabitans]RPE74896.1 aryl-alcohol dehydrogenase-like predicted oxidoreductase [Frondihabitans sp. PhB153]RPF04140.1 aryl-alcohol dehydrogenase-like predicted oxidoreductase [Frondihabitans sp. PhB161]
MKTRTIGDVTVSAIGLGAMPMSIEGRPERKRSIATIHAALEAGITFIDTADAYSLSGKLDDEGHNEILIAEALKAWHGNTDEILVATKGGHTRVHNKDGGWDQDGRPEHLKEAAKASAKRLGVESIGLYQFHRPDPSVPYADSIGALVELLDEGVIRMAGISNADVDQIREANDILDGRLVSVQNQFSPAFLSSTAELELCDEMSVAFLPWSPLGGITNAADLGQNHAVFAEIANARRVSPQVLTLAWELKKSEVVIPIPGSSRPQSIMDSATAASIKLSDEEFGRLEAASVPA